MSVNSENNKTRIGLVISLCLNSNNILDINILDIYSVVALQVAFLTAVPLSGKNLGVTP